MGVPTVPTVNAPPNEKYAQDFYQLITFSLDEAQWAVEHISEIPDNPVVITDERPDGGYDYTYHNGMYAFEFVR